MERWPTVLRRNRAFRAGVSAVMLATMGVLPAVAGTVPSGAVP
jgi:hypothetical protein